MDIRHTITRFGATALIGCGLVVTAIPATFAQNGEESVTHVYSDKATSHISEVWYKGETLKITGEGFLTQDGTSGSAPSRLTARTTWKFRLTRRATSPFPFPGRTTWMSASPWMSTCSPVP